MLHSLITTLPTLLLLLLYSAVPSLSYTLNSNTPSDPNIGTPCGIRDLSIPNQNIDCPAPLTCIPLDRNCTRWYRPNGEEYGFLGCPGTCQAIPLEAEQIYTKCGNMIYDTDCIEGNERCVGDPRRRDGTPSSDGPGICWPFRDMCGWDTGFTCPEGKVCFGGERSDNPNLTRGPFCVDVMYKGKRQNLCGGACFPLRYGADRYEKSREVLVERHAQSGWQGPRPPVWEEPFVWP